MLSATLALLMQVGPNPSLAPASSIPDELAELRRRQKEQETNIAPITGRLEACLARAEQDSTAARIEAQSWLDNAIGMTKAEALQCRGYAEANLGRWADAGRSFISARDAHGEVDAKYRARLGAMAGNAMIAAENNQQALQVLDRAEQDAVAAGFAPLLAEIAIDKARAHVNQNAPDAAALSLAEARRLAPNSARVWLLSATLARRMDDLPTAQSQIEQANRLDPTNPEVGLEAGVIAILTGNENAARQSWQSIVALSPASPQAQAAQSYLDQLGEPAPDPTNQP